MILAIETSTTRGSVALGAPDKIAAQEFFPESARPSEALFAALEKMQIAQRQLERIVVGLGPGSFSGVRVAIAAARGIALAQQCAVYGISSAFSVARQKKNVSRLGVFADARRGEFYQTIFALGELERSTRILSAPALEEEIGKVTLAVTAENIPLVPERAYPRAADLLELPPGLPQWVSGEALEPIYLREAVAG